MIKLISLDLDGTLLDPGGRVTSAAKAAIAKARAAGTKVVLNTGRPAPEAFWFVKEAGCDALVSALGGALLIDSATGKTIRRWDIPEPAARRALELCLGRGIELMIFAGERIVVDPFSKASLVTSYPYPPFHDNAEVAEDPVAYLREQGLPLTKLHGDGDPAGFPLAELAALEGLALTSSNDHDFEVVGAGVDKGRSLGELAAMYEIALEECAAVGDSDNDLAALQAAGMSIAMGNASQAVKDAAARIAPPNSQEGAAWAVLSCLE
ncbi:Cof-type HAD-IIB family hydrolase [bacterium 1xD42-67]|nr:Cof-type HAD-IIB family hydrolase [bacterium 1xD42-67]